MPNRKVRLDRYLVAAKLIETRERARALILEGCVLVSGRLAEKPGTWIDPAEPVRLVQADHPFVSRGGVKLEGALSGFDIRTQDKTALDVGASTGGFTHCLLSHGVRRVYAVDVGYGQFSWSLRNEPRVVLLERTNIRHLTRERIPEDVDLAVVDVSFISLKTVIPCVVPFLARDGELLCLIKPQFEVGKGNVGKQGVVRDPARIEEVLRGMEIFSRDRGLLVCGIRESVLRGQKGNREFFIHLRRAC